MFAEYTIAAIMSLAAVDKTATSDDRDRLQDALTGVSRSKGILVRYSEAARRLGVSVPTVKRLAKQGRLKKVYGLGNKNAIGVTEDSLARFAS